jgi:hypothetical protein
MPSRLAAARPFAWAWLIYTFLILVLALRVWIPSGLYKEMDFRAMYTGGMLARTDPSHLYNLSAQKALQNVLVKNDGLVLPFGHLAHEALFYVPFSLVDYRTAYLAMLLFNAILMACCFWAAREEFTANIPLWQPRAGLIFFAFIPVTIAMAQGQDSLMLLLILCLTWKLLKRSQLFAAGLLLAMLLFKPHLAVLLALFLALQYGWRFIAGFAAGSAIVAGICLPFWVHGGWSGWTEIIRGTSLAAGASQAEQFAFGVYPGSMPNLRGLLFAILGHALSARAFFDVVIVVSSIALLWAISSVKKLTLQNGFAFSIIVAVLLSYHFQEADLAILLLPMLLMETGSSKILSACRHLTLSLPIMLLIFAPATPSGAGFSLLTVPIAASVLTLGWQTGFRAWKPEPAIA